jgi:hypothetical protein
LSIYIPETTTFVVPPSVTPLKINFLVIGIDVVNARNVVTVEDMLVIVGIRKKLSTAVENCTAGPVGPVAPCGPAGPATP